MIIDWSELNVVLVDHMVMDAIVVTKRLRKRDKQN